ncbi:MAG: site-specific DNA-methyltransferase, partial [Candidatus Heimdallarchaeota archaeon]
MALTNNDIPWITDLAKPERDKGYTRTFYSYPAKFLSKLPRGLIERFSKKEELIFDPFVGGGTTGLEAMLLERQFIGYDINPFAILVS